MKVERKVVEKIRMCQALLGWRTRTADDPDSSFRAAVRAVQEKGLSSGGFVLQGGTIAELRCRVRDWCRIARKVGVNVQGWSRARVVPGPFGYQILVQAERPREEWSFGTVSHGRGDMP